MNCVKCVSPITTPDPALCAACYQAALDEYAEMRKLFVDSAVARDAKIIVASCDE